MYYRFLCFKVYRFFTNILNRFIHIFRKALMSKISRGYDKKKVLEILKNIFELEMAGVIRYTHYALMIFGIDFLLFNFLENKQKNH